MMKNKNNLYNRFYMPSQMLASPSPSPSHTRPHTLLNVV
jgi:hypothetical protein